MKESAQVTLVVESSSTVIMDMNSKTTNAILASRLDTKPLMFAKQSSAIFNKNSAINSVNKCK